MLNCLDEVIGFAGGSVALLTQDFESGMALATAVSAGTLITELHSHFSRHGPEAEKALKRARAAVKEAEERWADYDAAAIADWDHKLKRLLPACVLDRERLARSAVSPDGFPQAATQIILDKLIAHSGPSRGRLADRVGLGGETVTGEVFASGDAREFAADIIRSALRATYHDRKYYESIRPYLNFEMAASLGRVERDLGQVLDAMKNLGLLGEMNRQGYSSAAIEKAAHNFAAIPASLEAKAREVQFTIDAMDSAPAPGSDDVTAQAMEIARQGDFELASALLRKKRKAIEADIAQRQAAKTELSDLMLTIERLRQDPQATARAIFDDITARNDAGKALDDALVEEIRNRQAYASLFEAQVATELIRHGLNRPQILRFDHGRGWWRRYLAESLTRQDQFGGFDALEEADRLLELATQDCLDAASRFTKEGHPDHAAAAMLDTSMAIERRLKVRTTFAYRQNSTTVLHNLARDVRPLLDHDLILANPRAHAYLKKALAELLVTAIQFKPDPEYAAESRQLIDEAIDLIDQSGTVQERCDFRLLSAGQRLAAGKGDVAALLLAKLANEEACNLARENGSQVFYWPVYQAAAIDAEIDYATGLTQHLPRAIEGFQSALQMKAEQSPDRTWWQIQMQLARARCILAARNSDKDGFVAGADDLMQSQAIALEHRLTSPDADYREVRKIAETARSRNWPLNRLLESYEPH